MHDCWEGVIGGGAHIDVVVGVDGLLAAHGAAEDLDGAVGDDFVGVHVGLRAGAGLPDDEGEVVEEFEVGDLAGGLLDRLAEFGVYRRRRGQSRPGWLCRIYAVFLPRPNFMFTVAAAPLRMPKARTTGGGMRSCGWLILKFSNDRSVCAPQ